MIKYVHTESITIPLTISYSNNTTNGMSYGLGDNVIILSNMDTNDQREWIPVIDNMASDHLMIVTYNYIQQQDDQSEVLEDVILFIKSLGAKKILLIGASRGGVASLKVATNPTYSKDLVGIVALSAPIEYNGVVFYSHKELKNIEIPTLLINSEYDDGVNDTLSMFEILDNKKEFKIYPGSGHGTEILIDNKDSLLSIIQDFSNSVFA